MTEYALVPVEGAAHDPTVSLVIMAGAAHALDHTPQVGVWTVPDDVHSFTLRAGGAPATPYTAGFDPVTYPVEHAVIWDVPCTPGDQWLLEPGDPGTAPSVAFGGRGTLSGGAGRSVPFPTVDDPTGIAGGGASILSRRRGTDEVFAVLGGQGGIGVDNDSHRIPTMIVDEAPPGPVDYGGFTDLTGASPGASQGPFYGGGGGGGMPGGAAAAADSLAGESGGSYLPVASHTSAGGPPSPDSYAIANTGTWTPGGFAYGIVSIYYWTPAPAAGGWSIDAIEF